MTRREQLARLLETAAGPLTVADVAARLTITKRHASTHLSRGLKARTIVRAPSPDRFARYTTPRRLAEMDMPAPVEQRIVNLLRRRGPLATRRIAAAVGVSYQVTVKRLRTLAAMGEVETLPPAAHRSGHRYAARTLASTARACLGCGKGFPSEGPHNRLCDACKGRIRRLSPQYVGA